MPFTAVMRPAMSGYVPRGAGGVLHGVEPSLRWSLRAAGSPSDARASSEIAPTSPGRLFRHDRGTWAEEPTYAAAARFCAASTPRCDLRHITWPRRSGCCSAAGDLAVAGRDGDPHTTETAAALPAAAARSSPSADPDTGGSRNHPTRPRARDCHHRAANKRSLEECAVALADAGYVATNLPAIRN